MGPLKMYFLLKMGIFHCYVSLPEGNPILAPRTYTAFEDNVLVLGGRTVVGGSARLVLGLVTNSEDNLMQAGSVYTDPKINDPTCQISYSQNLPTSH